MQSLREKLANPHRFVIGTELVSVRGSMAERNGLKARHFASELATYPAVDWVSITDNAGGNPQLAPTALGKPILYAGKDVVIHLTCKDLNRNGLESEAWLLHSEGFHNILAMTGDFPAGGSGGSAKPVFDIDSVGLISLLAQMNDGLDPNTRGSSGHRPRFSGTQFLVGAVTTNFKRHEGEVVPQYRKLGQKIACGAHFIINQIGFNARKMHELHSYMQLHGLAKTPLIGNVYLLNGRVARLFHAGRIPGVVVTSGLLELCERHERSPDHGTAFFLELAAKQFAIYRGLGYRGVYLGGVHDIGTIDRLLQIEHSYAPDDWKNFVRELSFGQSGEYYLYGRDAQSGLADPNAPPENPAKKTRHLSWVYQLSKWSHAALFTPGRPLANWGAKACLHAADTFQGPRPLRTVETLSKAALFRCKDCGDCSLPEIAYLCPESQCAKNQRNGPCGGTRDGRCEVDGYGDCIWLRAYERLRHDGREQGLLDHAPVVQDQALRGTSAWANTWLGRDHTASRSPTPESESRK